MCRTAEAQELRSLRAMRGTRLSSTWEALRSSFWFVPALMTLAAAGLAAGSIWLDRTREIDEAWFLLYTSGASGARELLSTIASSMITVAGVVFSITMVALSFASSQLGPRLLREFMRDRGNQIVLGTFIATFVYCLLVLRTISEQEEFVPHLSATVALALAMAGLGVLIYFIHHTANALQADHVIALVSEELDASIRLLYPEGMGHDPPEDRREELRAVESQLGITPSLTVESEGSGYIHLVDGESLIRVASENELMVRVLSRPGRYVHDQTPVAEIWPADGVDERICRKVRGSFVIGRTRTSQQDVEFAINQLVEVAARALSRSLNDPFTAITCIDRLTTALLRLMRREVPDRYRMDEEGKLRVIADRSDFGGVVDAAFHQIRQFGAAIPAVSIHLLESLATLLRDARTEEQRLVLQHHVRLVRRSALRHTTEAADRADITGRALVAREAAGVEPGAEEPEQ
jgi:uncharacterized membrane protein